MKNSKQNSRIGRAQPLFLALLAGTATACASGYDDKSPEGELATEQLAIVPTDCGSPTECADVLHVNFDWGRWPGGVIRYRFASNFPSNADQTVRQAMADWSRMSGGAITFQETSDSSTTFSPVVTVNWTPGGGLGQPYTTCSSAGSCILNLDQNFAYHEIAHLIGYPHSFQRNDRRNYIRMLQGPGAGAVHCDSQPCSTQADCPAGRVCQEGVCRNDQWDRYRDGLHDYGPFDFFASAGYGNFYPNMTRWNGQPMVASSSCGPGDWTTATVCPGTNLSSIFCSTCGSGSSFLAGDLTCPVTRPGVPTPGDGSAVAEQYRNLIDPGWRKFARTSAFASATTPAVAELASGVTMTATASPAVVQLSPGTAQLFASGPNGRVYMKDLFLGQQWADIGAPGGTGTLSDPAVTSWDGSRIDLVVARKGSSSSVRIRTSTDYGGTWTAWASLGSPKSDNSMAPDIASAPALASWGPNRLDVLVRAGSRLYAKRCTANCSGASGTWSSWSQVGGSENVRGKPAVASRASGTFDVVVQNTSGQLRKMTNTNGTWSGWTTIPLSGLPNGALKFDSSCSDCSSPALGARTAASTDVYVRGQDDKVWLAECAAAGSCTSFVALGGVLSSSPAASGRPWGDGTAHLVAAMPEERNPGVFVYDAWVKTYNATHSYPRQLAVAPNADGRLEVLYNGVDDVLYRKWQPNWLTNGANPRYDVNGRAKKIAIGRNQNGKLESFYTTHNDELRRAAQFNPGSQYGEGQLLKAGVSDVAVSATTDGRQVAIMTGTDGVLYRAHQTAPNESWSVPTLLGQATNQAKRIAAVRDIDTRVEAIYIGADDVLYHKQNASLSAINFWTGQALIATATTTAKRIAVAVNEIPPVGRLDLFYTAMDDTLYRIAQSSNGWNWGTPVLLNAATHKAKELTVAVNQDGRLEVFYIGTNDVLYHTWQNSPGSAAWSGEFFLHDAGTTAAQLTASRNVDGRVEVFFVGLNDVIYHMWQVTPGSVWSAPVPL